MTKVPFKFGKITSSPTMTAWSHAYNAGNLAAVVSLHVKGETKELQAIPPLSSIGKDLLNDLEAEYFTLEEKNLTTIKQAIMTTREKIPEIITPTFAVTVIIENVLYVFLYGPGKILMKRGDKLGTLLEQNEEGHITSGSGFIENNDMIILETAQFAQIVEKEKLLPLLIPAALSDISDALIPILQKQHDGGASALVFYYHEENEQKHEKPSEKVIQHNHDTHAADEKQSKEQESETINENIQEIAFQPTSYPTRRTSSHKKRLFITILVFLIIIFLGSIFFFLKKKQQAANQAVFQSLVAPAQVKYDEAQSLMDLNKNAARNDLTQAQQMLQIALGKFSPKSTQSIQIKNLLAKITDSLTQASQISNENAKQVDNSTSSFLQAISKQNGELSASAQDDANAYTINANGITSISKSDPAKTKTVIKNNNYWKNAGGLGTYLGNFYVLDTTDGIIKFVPAGNSYTNSNYFADGVKPDLSKAVGIAIDGSIWILSSDGSIVKFTRGKQDNLSIIGLDKPLKNPMYIVTTADMNNLYVLDSGNSRIVVFDKKGNYLAQYQSGIINSAKIMDVSEKTKKIYILSNSITYEIDLK